MNEASPSARLHGDEAAAALNSAVSPSSARHSQSPTQGSQLPYIPDHELLRPIASGAYGEVWLARNVVGTLRAVKMVRRDQHASVESFEREFKGLQKFEPVSRSHEGLVDILTLGLLSDGAGFYYVMELADQAMVGPNVGAAVTRLTSPESKSKSDPPHLGYIPRTLRADLKSRSPFPAGEVIALGLKLTAALAHLHAQGLVHRDVKPSNILFIGGQPKLADAGLVAAMDDARSLVGTAGYIAPEGPGTPQADLYALGKVLYEAAFGKDRQEFPALPADVASRTDHVRLLELNEIIATACVHDPRQRYATAEAMLLELESLNVGKSVRGQRSRQRVWSYAKKFALAGAGLAIALAVIHWLADRKPRLTGSTQPPPDFLSSTNELALEEYRKGVHALQVENDNARAIQHFKNAIQKEPSFAEAWARLAWAHYSYGENDPNPLEGPAAAEKAVQLNPDLAYGRSMLATAKAAVLNWADADKERKRAIELNPNSQEILLESALNLACMGRTTEALEDLQKALRANPDSASNMREPFYGLVYGWCRQYDRALEYNKRIPNTGYFGNQQRALTYLGLGDFTNFMRFSKQALLARADNADQVNVQFEALDKTFKEGGEPKYWGLSLEFEASRRDPDHLMRMAAIHAHLNQPGEAFRYLRQAMQETPNWFSIGFHTNPSFDSLRNKEEFQAIKEELWRRK